MVCPSTATPLVPLAERPLMPPPARLSGDAQEVCKGKPQLENAAPRGPLAPLDVHSGIGSGNLRARVEWRE